MCNRVRRTYTHYQVIELFEAPFAPRRINADALRETNLEPRWNVAPKSVVPVLRKSDGELRFELLHWDMCPAMPWWTKPRAGETAEQAAKRRKPLMTNAVIEKVKTTGAIAVITIPASPWMSAIQDRMPAMLPANAWRAYLDAPADDLAAMGSCTPPLRRPRIYAKSMHGQHMGALATYQLGKTAKLWV
jgi:putative SOS response-associated peptidase YedK